MLVDLDELALRVRDPESRRNVEEAVRVLHAGSPRSAIMLTWLAVVFDVVAKLRELADAGDAQAKTHRDEFEEIRASGDVKRAQEFEGRIPTIALGLELISNLQKQDLERLHQDRHRCAHPSQVEEGVAYAPTSELARAHLRNAVESLLEHPPAQGKAALKRLQDDVDSPYFPHDVTEAVQRVRQSMLHRGRISLVRNFVVASFKTILDAESLSDLHTRRRAAIAALWQVRPEVMESVAAEKLVKLCADVDDGKLKNVLFAARVLPRLWHTLGADLKDKLTRFVEKPPTKDERHVTMLALPYEEFDEIAIGRLLAYGRDDYEWVMNNIGQQMPPEIAKLIATVVMEHSEFEDIARTMWQLAPLSGHMPPEQVRSAFDLVVDDEGKSRLSDRKDLERFVVNLEWEKGEKIFAASRAATLYNWEDLLFSF